MILHAIGDFGYHAQNATLERALPALTRELASEMNDMQGHGKPAHSAPDAGKSREYAEKVRHYSDKMLNLVELMRAFGSTSGAFSRDRDTLAGFSKDLLGLVRCISRVNGTTVTVELADDCRERELASLEVRLIVLVILETLVRSGCNADKALKVEMHCTTRPGAVADFPGLPERWLNIQLHEAAKQLREAGGEIELSSAPHGMTARFFVPVKSPPECQ